MQGKARGPSSPGLPSEGPVPTHPTSRVSGETRSHLSAGTGRQVTRKGRRRQSSRQQATSWAQLLRHVTVVRILRTGLELPAATRTLGLCLSSVTTNPEGATCRLPATRQPPQGNSATLPPQAQRATRKPEWPGMQPRRQHTTSPTIAGKWKNRGQEGCCRKQEVRICIFGRQSLPATFLSSLRIFRNLSTQQSQEPAPLS